MTKFLALATLALSLHPAFAATPDSAPVLIGSVNLSEANDFDYKNVTNVCGLRKVRLFVTNDSAHIEYVAVVFGNGETQRINVRSFFARDSWSSWKDLNGRERCVSAFMVYGHSSSRPRDARINLIGK